MHENIVHWQRSQLLQQVVRLPPPPASATHRRIDAVRASPLRFEIFHCEGFARAQLLPVLHVQAPLARSLRPSSVASKGAKMPSTVFGADGLAKAALLRAVLPIEDRAALSERLRDCAIQS